MPCYPRQHNKQIKSRLQVVFLCLEAMLADSYNTVAARLTRLGK